jgi:bifunctional non-homologous end joining protein LigD
MTLTKYKQKRKFQETPEPSGKKNPTTNHRFVVQRHHASRLHYDLRLELDGVLKSWAVPKGPSLNPKDKRLAMMVEDHPVDYISFEGEIPKGNYGAGMVIIWDKGTFTPINEKSEPITDKQALAALKKGQLKFHVKGKRLKGEFALVKIKNNQSSGDPWLLVKHRDDDAVDKKYNSEDFVTSQDKNAGEKKKEAPDPPRPRVNIRFPKSSMKLTQYQKPMLATLTDNPFDDKEWIFEIKWDGYRAVAEVTGGNVKFYSRNGLSFLEKFAVITESLQKIKHNVVLDGEVVLLNDNQPDFQKLQQYEDNYHLPLVYYVFDLLNLDGKDLKTLPLVDRKEILKKLTDKINDPVIRYSDHIEEKGKAFFEMARNKNLEGIIAKKADSEYANGYRSKQWLKIKYQLNREAIIAGYTKPRGSRKHFGALILAQYEKNKLVYIGHTGTGFNQQMLKDLYQKMQPLVIEKSPFSEKIKTNMPVTWLKPNLVCQVNFTEATEDGKLRHPVYMGLREDKNFKVVEKETEEPLKNLSMKTVSKKSVSKALPKKKAAKKEVVKAIKKTAVKSSTKPTAAKSTKKPASSKEINHKKLKKSTSELVSPDDKGDKTILVEKRTLTLTNLDKIYYPDDHISKGEILAFYEKISPFLLPYLKDRPLSLLRHPNGIEEKGFFQKNVGGQSPEWMNKIDIHSDSGNKVIHYVMCNDLSSLLYIANLGCIEMNPWNSTAKKIENPTWMVIDIDPADKSTFEQVIETANVTRDVISMAGAECYCKTSGATGLHVYVPMGNRYTYDQVKEFGEIIAILVQEQLPAFTSIERSLKKRGQKIYVDFLQNRRGQTLATAYSARPKPGATVSTPLLWKEVKNGLHPSQFDIKNIFKRLEKQGDLFSGVLGKGIDLYKCLKQLGA